MELKSALLVMTALLCWPGTAAPLADRADALVGRLPDMMTDAHVPGLSLVVISAGDMVFEKAFGIRNLTSNDALRLEDVFEAASNGKVIAAYQAFRLVEQGKLRLDDPVSDRRLTSKCGPLSLIELLTHTGGLGNDIGADSFTVDCSLRGEFSYAGQGYVLLDALIHSATGEPASDSIKKDIFGPLAMHHTTFDVSEFEIVSGHPDMVFGTQTSGSG